jgi:hypothetical protein
MSAFRPPHRRTEFNFSRACGAMTYFEAKLVKNFGHLGGAAKSGRLSPDKSLFLATQNAS